MTSVKKVSLDDTWKMRQVVMYPEETLDFVKLEDDNEGIHLGLYLGDQLVTVISLFERGDNVQFRKFATLSNMQGRGFGTVLLQHVMKWAGDNNKKTIWCNARSSATAMYRKFGMIPTGDSWNKYGIDFIKMEKSFD